jgi:hypothetical protein
MAGDLWPDGTQIEGDDRESSDYRNWHFYPLLNLGNAIAKNRRLNSETARRLQPGGFGLIQPTFQQSTAITVFLRGSVTWRQV